MSKLKVVERINMKITCQFVRKIRGKVKLCTCYAKTDTTVQEKNVVKFLLEVLSESMIDELKSKNYLK